MSTDERQDGSETSDGEGVDRDDAATDDEGGERGEGPVRTRIGEEAERARTEFDDRLVDLLSWLLDTETRARIYVYLRQNPGSTSEEIAGGTGLYPSTVREALASLNEEGTVERRKREASGAGNNPYEYTAMPPSDLVGSVVEDVQEELNTVFNMDRHLRSRSGGSEDTGDEGAGDEDGGPVSITVEEREGETESRDAD